MSKEGRTLIEKLDRFDLYAGDAVDELIRLLELNRHEIITVARARHITGHFVHADGELFEYSPGRLTAETFEELADGVVYTARRLDIES
jgi:hypothetical protein